MRSRCEVKRVNYTGVWPNKIALLFTGRGAQSVGMGRDPAEQFPVAAVYSEKQIRISNES
jgi:acyl transferase domain-containing protein